MIPDQYVWFAWSVLFMVPWVILYLVFRRYRQAMLWASLFTAPFGLIEPLFVPEYWNPPSLFNLAQRTGFDIESIIFCFGIGGVTAALYDILGRVRLTSVPLARRHAHRHRFHYLALGSPFIIFFMLIWFPWNPIYPSIIAMFAGSVATVLCRPDLLRKTWRGGLLFLVYYVLFLNTLEWLSPGYIQQVWNLDALSGVYVLEFPIEEFLFAIGFGLYWSGAYEHFTWHQPVDGTAQSEHRKEAES